MPADLVQVTFDPPSLPEPGSATAIARLVEVDDQTTYELADQRLVAIKRSWREIDAKRKAIVDPINKAKEAVQALFRPVLDDLDAAETVIKSKLLDFRRAEEAKRAAEQARLDDLARKERERLAKEAAKAEAKGRVEEAAVLAATAAVVTAPVVTGTVSDPKGSSVKRVWRVEVTDLPTFLRAVSENPAFLNLIEVNQSALNKLAAALDGNLPLAGCRPYQEENMSRRVA